MASVGKSTDIDRVPNELLLWILLEAASDLESTVALSHVCRRFRSIIVGSREFWYEFDLLSTWSVEQICTVAERSAPYTLRVQINPPSNSTVPRTRMDFLESLLATLALSSRIDELHISNFEKTTDWQENILCQLLKYTHFGSLAQLCLFRSASVFLSFTPQNIPSLQSLDIDFVPDLVQARNLVEFTLSFDRGLMLGQVLRFLACADALKTLEIFMGEIVDRESVDDLSPIFMYDLDALHLVTCDTETICDVEAVVKKVRAPTLSKLEIELMHDDFNAEIDSIHEIMTKYPSIRRLKVLGFPRVDLWRIPQNVEELILVETPETCTPSIDFAGPLNRHRLRLVRLEDLRDFSTAAVLSMRELFKRNNIAVSFEFDGCRGFRNGVFDMAKIETAFI